MCYSLIMSPSISLASLILLFLSSDLISVKFPLRVWVVIGRKEFFKCLNESLRGVLENEGEKSCSRSRVLRLKIRSLEVIYLLSRKKDLLEG